MNRMLIGDWPEPVGEKFGEPRLEIFLYGNGEPDKHQPCCGFVVCECLNLDRQPSFKKYWESIKGDPYDAVVVDDVESKERFGFSPGMTR